jgi:hypothetical protein
MPKNVRAFFSDVVQAFRPARMQAFRPARMQAFTPARNGGPEGPHYTWVKML